MARRRRESGRGISIGTIVMLVICLLTLVLAAVIFLRISGDIEEITIDPDLLEAPLTLTELVGEDGQLGFYAGARETDNEPEEPFAAPPPEETQLALAVTPLPTEAPTPEPTAPPARPVTITAGGIVAMGNELRVSGRNKDTGVYDFTSILTPIAGAFSGSDLSIATVRASLGAEQGSYDANHAPYELAGALKMAGLNMLNFATDHLLDHGLQGVTDTAGILHDLTLSSAGIFSTAEERQAPATHDFGSVKIGILPFTASVSSAGRKAVSAEELATATRVYDAATIQADIDALRQAGANVVVVLAHWGSRTDTKPSPATKEIADALVAAGADVILGTNPSSVHEIEKRAVATPDGGTRDVLIAYSLGNLLSDDSRDTPAITGVILRLTIEWDAATQRASYTDNWYMPTWIMRWKDAGGVSRYRVVPSGVSTRPEDMQESLYKNIQKTYENMITKLGTDIAQPKAEP